MRIKFRWIPTLFLAVSILFLGNFVGCRRSGQVSLAGQLAKDAPAPDFSLQDVNGHTVSLSQFKGKVIVLDFWATWCPPCRQEIPHLTEFYNQNKDKGVVLIGIALDDDGLKAVKPFVNEHKVTYPVVIGDAKVQQAYGGIQGIPTKFIINKEGKIVQTLVGYQTVDTIQKAVQPLL